MNDSNKMIDYLFDFYIDETNCSYLILHDTTKDLINLINNEYVNGTLSELLNSKYIYAKNGN